MSQQVCSALDGVVIILVIILLVVNLRYEWDHYAWCTSDMKRIIRLEVHLRWAGDHFAIDAP